MTSSDYHAPVRLVDEAMYDALIVGARVAGATLAAFIGDAGYRVLLVDRDCVPSSTLSTHYFRGGRAVASSSAWAFSTRYWRWVARR